MKNQVRKKSLKRKSSKRKPGTRKPPSAEAIARLADRGVDISRFFTCTGRMVRSGGVMEASAPILRKT